MPEDKKQKVAVFRYGVISRLVWQKGKKEPLIREITSAQWEIPYCGRSYIGRSTVLEWLNRYESSGGNLESLYPQGRSDTGKARCMDEETEKALVNLKKDNRGVSLPLLLKSAKEKKILPLDFRASKHSLYRLFKRHGIDKEDTPREDMRRYEAELPNVLWQGDTMHGPMVVEGGKERKTFLFIFIDDNSRLIPHAEFYIRENLESLADCLIKGLRKRGLPKKLYIDNGPTFRANQLGYAMASMGIALIHSTPYRPQGKGKIERLIKTVRMSFLPTVRAKMSLVELNELLWTWIEKEYHQNEHSVTREKPLERYLKHVNQVRPAPENLIDYFRKRTTRKVDKDRTVTLMGRVYEAPVQLMERTVTLLYHEENLERIEVLFKNESYGLLVPLNPHVNSRVRRNKTTEILTKELANKDYRGGKLFEKETQDE
jgi:transposase InsO family protein